VSEATCRIDGTVGQRITFEAPEKRYVTFERTDGKRLGSREILYCEWHDPRGPVANRISVEFITGGSCRGKLDLVVGNAYYPSQRKRVIAEAKAFLGVEKLPLAHCNPVK
jgi:hypothetical protein